MASTGANIKARPGFSPAYRRHSSRNIFFNSFIFKKNLLIHGETETCRKKLIWWYAMRPRSHAIILISGQTLFVFTRNQFIHRHRCGTCHNQIQMEIVRKRRGCDRRSVKIIFLASNFTDWFFVALVVQIFAQNRFFLAFILLLRQPRDLIRRIQERKPKSKYSTIQHARWKQFIPLFVPIVKMYLWIMQASKC